MTKSCACAAGIALCLLAGCSSTGPSAPPITAAIVQAGARQYHDEATLARGRTLFVNRCARCHAMKSPGSESAEEWPQIVAKMAKRSGLDAAGERAVLAYILAAQASGAE